MKDKRGTVMSNETKDANKVGLSRRKLLKVTAAGLLAGVAIPLLPYLGSTHSTASGIGRTKVDPDLYLHVVERKKDGIVVRGCKSHQTGIVNSHEVIVMPTAALRGEDKD